MSITNYKEFYQAVKESLDPKTLLSEDEILYWLRKDIAELEGNLTQRAPDGLPRAAKNDDPEK